MAEPPGDDTTERTDPRPIVLFDGVCTLCNATVDFIMRRDPHGRFRFAPLQSEQARALLGPDAHRIASDGDPGTIVLIEGDRRHERSTAALHIAARLRFPWNLLRAFTLVPRPLRDAVYDWVARNRYRWFGKRSSCRVPGDEDRSHFV